MSSSNWILNFVIWGLLAVGVFFGLKAQIRRSREAQEAEKQDATDVANEPDQKEC